MKKRTKSVIILMITLFTVIMIGTTKVSAVEIEITDEMRNQENYSETEQQKVNEIAKSINGTVVITPELSEIRKENEEIEKDPANYDFSQRMFEKAIEKAVEPLKNAGYKLVECGGSGGGGDNIFTGVGSEGREIYKNNIYYGTVSIEVQTQGKLTIPNTVEDTETAIINYAIPKIEEFVEFEAQESTYKKGDGVTLTKATGDSYRVFNKRTQNLIGTVLLKKEPTTTITKEDKATGIKLETTTATVQSNVTLVAKIVTDKSTEELIINAIKSVGKFTPYNIDLMKDNVKIQPNGKVKVSIPIPEGYDKTKLEIYRVEENGKTIKYDVKVEGNYATFETDHFSIYVLAEKKAETTTTTTPTKPTQEQTKPVNKGEKDNTPKTGITDITKYIVAVAVISAVGIIVLKKKETK